MSKIIENVWEQLLTEAKKQIRERGYADTTIRSVAGTGGLGVGFEMLGLWRGRKSKSVISKVVSALISLLVSML